MSVPSTGPAPRVRRRSNFDYFVIDRIWQIGLYVVGGAIIFYLVSPLVAVIPLSFNSEPYFTFPMPGTSTRWYDDLFNSPEWQRAARSSFITGISVTILATVLGTLAAVGMTLTNFKLKAFLIGLLLSPMMVPHLVTGVGMFFFYAWAGLVYTLPGLIMAHTVVALPFVILTVSATLANFNVNLIRAGASMGAGPVTVFFRIILPVIAPGVLAGAVLAFVASFDELIITLLISGPEWKTIPRQMWNGVREEITPVITAAATLLIGFSVLIMVGAEMLRRRGERLRSQRSSR